MNVRGHAASGNIRFSLPIAMEQLRNAHRIMRKYNQCLRLARYASASPHQWAAANALARIAQGIGWFIIRLRMEGQIAEERQYRISALSVCKFAVSVAARYKDDATLSYAVTAAMLLIGKDHSADERQEHETFAREAVGKIRNPKQRRSAEQVLAHALMRLAGDKVEGDPEHDVIRQVIENRAASLGIEMNNPNDSRCRLVRLGIKDFSCERAVRHCEHAFVSISRNVPPQDKALADLLQLPSICGKIMHCDLLNYAIEERTLDQALSEFKARHCNDCQQAKARPLDWVFSEEWQEQENLRHRAFMREFYKGKSSSPT